MKAFIVAFATLIAGLALPAAAQAYVGVTVGFGGHPHPYYGYYHPYYYNVHSYWHHGYYQGRYGWWWVNGPSWTYYDQPVYPYPAQTVVVQQQAPVLPPPGPTTVIMQQPESAISELPAANTQPISSGAVYYYCRDPQGYYPTVQSCPSGWAASPAPAPK